MATHPDQRGSQPMSNNKKGLIAALIGVLALFVGIVGFEVVSYRPSFCAGCHSSDYTAWRKSTHRDTTCYDCHAKRGSLSAALNKANEYAMVVTWFTGRYDKPITAFVNNGACLVCHEDRIRFPVAKFGIRMRHSDVIAAGMRCTDCHNTVAHGRATRSPTAPYMDTCTRCHNGGKARTSCSVCHFRRTEKIPTVRVAPWAITHGAKWTKTHGMGNLTTCTVCHPRNYCVRCHGLTLPHRRNWPSFHGKAAIANSKIQPPTDKAKSCVGCHFPNFCDGCHRVKMPHPNGFLRIHSREYRRTGKDICMNCHVQDECDECHVRHVHPGKLRDPYLKPIPK